jgi:hypothetical protein
VSAFDQHAMADADLESNAVIDTFIEFLIVAIYQILQGLNIYSPGAFILTVKYDLIVYQNRHRGVCDYINRVTTAAHQEILSGKVKRIKVVTFVQDSPREQFVFDITPFFQFGSETPVIEANAEQEIFSVDAEQQLRGVLSKLKDYCDSLEPSNDQKNFGIFIEKDRDSVLCSGNEEQWKDIPNPHMGTGHHVGERATNMVKIRSVQTGRLVFALWYEPAQTPSQLPTYTSGRPVAPDGSSSHALSDMYGTFPSSEYSSRNSSSTRDTAMYSLPSTTLADIAISIIISIAVSKTIDLMFSQEWMTCILSRYQLALVLILALFGNSAK